MASQRVAVALLAPLVATTASPKQKLVESIEVRVARNHRGPLSVTTA